MKGIFKILSLFMLVCLITAEDCSNSSSETTRYKIQQDQFQSIEDGFISNEISPEALHAFEVRAVQKVKDLNDYITIYLDENLEKEFREQAKKMIYSTFYSNEDCGRFFEELDLNEDIEQVLLSSSEIKNRVIFRTNSIHILEGILESKNLEYSGKIGFSTDLFEIVENDTILISRNKFALPILVVKKEKDFGTGSEKVWEVLFEDMRNLNPDL